MYVYIYICLQHITNTINIYTHILIYTGIKMVLSGEGSDEVFAGYLYFHKAPNSEELHAELRDKIRNLYLFDCLRANKSTSAWGLEARVPFLDRDFLDVAMMIDPVRLTAPTRQNYDLYVYVYVYYDVYICMYTYTISLCICTIYMCTIHTHHIL